MSEETRKVLEMLSNGTINVQEAEKLLQAVSTPSQGPDEKSAEPRYFRILVNKPAADDRARSWSTSGRQIYFMSFRPSTGGDMELFVMNADGTGVQRLTTTIGVDGSPRAR
jgi:hypothetical protein